MNKRERHQDVIEILRTLKNHKIYTHSTNKNKEKKNLADKLIEIRRKFDGKKFNGEKALRLVSIVNYILLPCRSIIETERKRLTHF